MKSEYIDIGVGLIVTAPNLTPLNIKGLSGRNVPEKIAQTKRIGAEDVKRAALANTANFFRLDPALSAGEEMGH